MQLKDISSRCMIDMENITKNDFRVFYFKPNSPYLEDPEKQKAFRQDFLDTVGNIRQPNATLGLADQLDGEMRETIIDNCLSDPC